ncbi:MAG: hypothetical protein IAG10_26265 [Planctomycetaceae bacterium]|nr:hypothetical protein [Planctomycetaceae bacterium]
MPQERRRFCIQIDPRQEIELLLQLSKRGTITSDKSATVLWAELSMTEVELCKIIGVVKAIEYIQPKWPDVLADIEGGM